MTFDADLGKGQCINPNAFSFSALEAQTENVNKNLYFSSFSDQGGRGSLGWFNARFLALRYGVVGFPHF